MDKATAALFTATERALLEQAEPARLKNLDVEALSDLHDRVRRLRTKLVGQYRRGSAQRVSKAGARGEAFAKGERAREKAEVVEGALAAVSTALATAARKSAAELKAERITAARGTAPAAKKATSTTAKRAAAPAKRTPAAPAKAASGSRRPTASQVKKNSSVKATGARRQAKRDSR